MLLLLLSSHGLLAGGRCSPPTVRRAALSLSLVAAASTWDDEALGGLSGAMHHAIRDGDAARVRELLDEACAGGDAHSRAALLQPGAVEAGGSQASAEAGPWASALHLAAQYDQPMLVPLLLEAGASTAARDGGGGGVGAGGGGGSGGGATPLMVAAAHGSSRTAAALLAAGADRHAGSAAGSVVHVAAAHGSVGVLRLLWDDARTISDVSTPGPGGWPPLHAAALHGQDGAVRELLRLGADLNPNPNPIPNPDPHPSPSPNPNPNPNPNPDPSLTLSRLGADRTLLAHGQTALDVATSSVQR